jgi:hypothetical protein
VSRSLGLQLTARRFGIDIFLDDRPPPPTYAEVVNDVSKISNILAEVKAETGPATLFNLRIPSQLFRADAFGTAGERPLRVLSLGQCAECGQASQ